MLEQPGSISEICQWVRWQLLLARPPPPGSIYGGWFILRHLCAHPAPDTHALPLGIFVRGKIFFLCYLWKRRQSAWTTSSIFLNDATTITTTTTINKSDFGPNVPGQQASQLSTGKCSNRLLLASFIERSPQLRGLIQRLELLVQSYL